MYLNQEIKDFKYLVKNYTDDANHALSSRVKQALHRNLVRLAKNPSKQIRKFDKENGMTIFSAQDYYKKLYKIMHNNLNLKK